MIERIVATMKFGRERDLDDHTIAAAILTSLREPTAEMVNAAYDGPTFQSARESEIAAAYRIMIDEALK